ncbi:hypothetical protein Tco_1407774 [Tanacetum coccineum]
MLNITLWLVRENNDVTDESHLQKYVKRKYAANPNIYYIRIQYNGVFKKWPGRSYDEGKVNIVDLVDIDEVLVEEMDSLMVQMSYARTINRKSEGYDTEDEVTENIKDGNVLVDKDNIIEEPGVEVSLFEVSKVAQIGNIGYSSMIHDDLILENDLDVIDNNDFESDCVIKGDVDYVRKNKLKEYRKKLRAKEDDLIKKDIKACDYKFLSKHIFDQVQVNPDILARVVQDQLVKHLKCNCPYKKALRAKNKEETDIRGDHKLQYKTLRDFVVELQKINRDTTIRVNVQTATDPKLPTRVFTRIYVCLGALKACFQACPMELLGLDGTFMRGTFPGQLLSSMVLIGIMRYTY